MKKALLFLALFVLVFTLAFAVSVNAETKAPTLSIEAYNLTFGNSVYINYAVNAQNIPDGATVELLIFDNYKRDFVKGNECSVAKLTTDTTVQNGVTCSVYIFDEIVAKQMATDFYSVIYVKSGSNEYYSTPTKYSVLQYVYNKLGYTGEKSDKETYRDLLSEALVFGAKAQAHFAPDDTRLANGKFQNIVANNATLPDGFANGLYLPGDLVTLTANEAPEGYVFSHWTDPNGANVGSEATVEIEIQDGSKGKTQTYSAVYKLDAVESESNKFIIQTVTDSGTVYFNGTVSNSSMQTTANKDEAVPVYLEKVGAEDNQYYLYYMTSAGVKTYIAVGTNTSLKASSTAPTDTYYYFDANGALVDNATGRFIGSQKTANTMKAYAISNITSAKYSVASLVPCE